MNADMNADSRDRPDIVVILTDQERAIPPYENDALSQWRHDTLTGRRWFDEHGVRFERHYTGSLACVPSRPTLFTGQFPDVHGVTQTNGLGKMDDDSRMRWLREGEVPTMGHWFRAGGYDTHYDGKWHITHADLTDPITGDVSGHQRRATATSTPRRSSATSTPTRSVRSGSPAGSGPNHTAQGSTMPGSVATP